MEARGQPQLFLLRSWHLGFVLRQSLSNLGLVKNARKLSVSSRDPPVSASPALGLKAQNSIIGSIEGLNSGGNSKHFNGWAIRLRLTNDLWGLIKRADAAAWFSGHFLSWNTEHCAVKGTEACAFRAGASRSPKQVLGVSLQRKTGKQLQCINVLWKLSREKKKKTQKPQVVKMKGGKFPDRTVQQAEQCWASKEGEACWVQRITDDIATERDKENREEAQ